MSVVKGTLSGEYVALGTFAGTVLIALSVTALPPRQKTLQRNCVSCSFVAVMVPYSIDVIPIPVVGRRCPLHLWERFVNLHEKSKTGIQKQKIASTD